MATWGLIGSSTAAAFTPYTFNWREVATGNYSLTAKVTDSLGATTVSAPVAITVLGATEFGISSPQSGTSFVAPAAIKLTAVNVAANIAGGPEFYKMSSFGGDPILIGGATSSDGSLTYTYLWSAGTAGTYTIKASQWVYLYGQNQLPTQFWSQPVTLTVTPNPDPATITYLHNDLSGSPIAATDENGTVIWKESYQPYGGRVRNETAAGDNRQFYTGKPFDAETGLSYFGARYFDPVSGRFMGMDPQGFKEGNIHSFNRYAYANNNPYKFVDPDGRSPRLLWLAGEASYYVATRFGAGLLGSAIGIELYNVLHQESAETAPAGSPLVGPSDKLPNQGPVTGGVEGAPPVDAGKQGKHVPGHNNEAEGKSKWNEGENGVRETQQAWGNGRTVRPDGSVRVGQDDSGRDIKVHQGGEGNIHGYPTRE